MAFIVKSSLSIEPTILSWDKEEEQKLIKEKQEFLKSKEASEEKIEEKTELKEEVEEQAEEEKTKKNSKKNKKVGDE